MKPAGERDTKPHNAEPYWVMIDHQQPHIPQQRDSIDAAAAWLRRYSRALIAVGLVVALPSVVIPRLLQAQRARQFKGDAIVAVEAFDAVSSAIEVGVLHADYAKRVADAKVTVDRFLRKWPLDLAPPLRAIISSVMDDFGLALEAWGERLKGEPWTRPETDLGQRLLSVPGVHANRYGVHLNTARQVVWARALQDLNRAREMLGLAAKAIPAKAEKPSAEQELDRIKEDYQRAVREAEIRRLEQEAEASRRAREAICARYPSACR